MAIHRRALGAGDLAPPWLHEILAPHGLKAERVAGSVYQIVRDRTTRSATSATQPAELRTRRSPTARASMAEPDRADGGYAESVTVTAERGERADHGVSSVTLNADDFGSGSSPLQDDPWQAVRALPGVATLDDFRSDFSVRGSPSRQVGIVVDGVAAPWLQHAMFGRSDAGSLSMFGSGSFEQATLQSGAYPQRYDDRLGAQLSLTLREGSRESTRVHGSWGATSARVVAEGPLGHGRVTVFAEALNVLNRQNLAPAEGVVQPFTGVVTDFSRALAPRRASIGFEIRFGDDQSVKP